MRIVSWNVNGLRSVFRKGFLDWFRETSADIVCLQEIKVRKEQLTSDLIKLKNYYSYFNSAQRKGYSGVIVYSKKKPLSVKRKIGLKKFDEEGRLLILRYRGFTLISLYMPHGGRQKENLDYKLEVYDYLYGYLKEIRNQKVILIGDFNIAHKEIDLARPRQNQKNIMFTREERKQVDKLVKLGFTDSFRMFYQEEGNYTWWSYSFKARERNLGWRIDYTFISNKLKPNLKEAFIMSGVKGSDHCPIGIEI